MLRSLLFAALLVPAAHGQPAAPDSVYLFADRMPELSDSVLAQAVASIDYPADARADSLEGVVLVQVVVAPDGTVADAAVLRGLAPSLDAEAVRAARSLTFTPGAVAGVPVAVRTAVPILFSLAVADAREALTIGFETAPEMLPDMLTGLRRLQEAIRYPVEAKRAGIEGQVLVRFTVTEAGRVADARVERNLGYGTGAEALRVVRPLRFRPAVRDGQHVASELTLPITFRLRPPSAASGRPDCLPHTTRRCPD